MLRFLAGLVFGAVVAIASVRLGVTPPGLITLPQRLQDNITSTAVDGPLYAVNGDPGQRERALAVYFQTRSQDAARLDAAAGGPFLKTLHRARARREARQLLALWSGYDEALAQPALRAVLEAKYETQDDATLKRRMLAGAVADEAFLGAWMEAHGGPVAVETVRERLQVVASQAELGGS